MHLGLGLSGIAAAYGAVIVSMPRSWGSEVFGANWAEASTLVAIVAVDEMLRMGTFAAIDLVKVLGAPMDLVRTRLGTAIGRLSGLLVGAAVAGPRGAAIGGVLGAVVMAITWWRQARIVRQRSTTEHDPAVFM
jgi:hypothetical protein